MAQPRQKRPAQKNRCADAAARAVYLRHWRRCAGVNAAAFAAAWGIGRSTHWRWVSGKLRGFRGRPRVSRKLRRAVVALDRRYRSTWGARELAHVLGLGHTTVAKILREGRGPKPARLRRNHERRTRFLRRDVMWSSDFMRLPGGWWLIKTIDEASGLRLAWDVVRAPTAGAAVRHARKLLERLGRAPLVWKFDHGSGFTSGEFRSLLAARDIAAYPTRCRAPWTNGRCERDNRDLRAWLIPVERRRLGLNALRREVGAGLRMLNRARPRAVLGYRTAARVYRRLPGIRRVGRKRFLSELRAARGESRYRLAVRRALKRRGLYDKPDPAVERVWAREAQRRWKAYKSGKLKAVTVSEVLGRFRPR